ncbi:HNH endonuclease [Rhodococcoides fascians]|uniref:HNH endonuclease n=1 Tax=Rhodococcoides fascians TaxID=1828 RepID=UPI0012FE2226|nr:HNH endonuclease [Rhodococcus fascians]
MRDRIMSKCQPGTGKFADCLEWVEYRDKDGYGRTTVRGQKDGAHRVAYRVHVGPIPDGKRVLHTCDNPPCINPDHLFLGDPVDNTRDMMTKGRNRISLGARNGFARVTEGQVLELRSLYATGATTYRELAAKFGLSIGGVADIVKRRNWKHI